MQRLFIFTMMFNLCIVFDSQWRIAEFLGR